jgi:hypothetical protein
VWFLPNHLHYLQITALSPSHSIKTTKHLQFRHIYQRIDINEKKSHTSTHTFSYRKVEPKINIIASQIPDTNEQQETKPDKEEKQDTPELP